MSAIVTYLKVEHIRLEAGEILILDGMIYLIESVERLYYGEHIAMTANQAALTTVITNLRPEDDEVYHCEYIGISHEYYEGQNKFVFPSGAIFRVAYPRGDQRYTPHGLGINLDENIASRLDPWRVDLWIKPSTEPAIISDNTLAMALTFKVWFYGWKYRTKAITKTDLTAARGRGVKVLEIERYVSK